MFILMRKDQRKEFRKKEFFKIYSDKNIHEMRKFLWLVVIC